MSNKERVGWRPRGRLLGVFGPHKPWFRWAAQLAVILGLGLLNRPEAGAQPVPERRAAEVFSDSIAAATDREALRMVERGLLLRAKRDRLNPTLHFRLGSLALKQGEVNDAGVEFKWATQLDPRWAAAWFGWGQAELALGELADTTKIGRRALLARDAWSRATTAFARAIAIDSSWALKAEALVGERASGAPASAGVVREGLRRVVSGGAGSGGGAARSAVTLLALGRVERLLGDSGAALVAFDRAVGSPGGRGLGLLEAARTRLASGDRQGIANYFAAAATDDSASVALLRSEVRWIATADELVRFDASQGADRAAMLKRFWTSRDRTDLRQDGERLLEHARRLGAARRLYQNPDDQRVAVLVRHGEPDSRAAARPAGVSPNESWRYRRLEGDLIVHFVAGADTTNYRVVESVFDVLADDGRAAGDERPAAPIDLVELLLRSRAQLSPFYQAAAAGRRDRLATFRAREREIGRASRNLALTTDRFPLRFDRDLTARVRILSGGSGSAGKLELVFAIPGFVFDSTKIATPARYDTRVRLTIWDSAETAFPVDTIMTTWLDQPVAADGIVAGVASVPLPPGVYSVRAVLEADARGTVASRDGVAIGGAGDRPMLSDLAVGLAGFGLNLESGRPIDPAASFRRADTVRVSAVLFGGRGAGPIRVRYLLRPVSGIGKEGRWRDFPGRSGWTVVEADENGVIGISLPLRSVKSGPYELEAIVAMEGGVEVRQRTRFEVVEAPR